MSDLASRIEAAEGASAALFEEAFWAVNPNYADIRQFRVLLDAEAWFDAALTLVPEGCHPVIDFRQATAFIRTREGYDTTPPGYSVAAATPALALCAAALRAKEARHAE